MELAMKSGSESRVSNHCKEDDKGVDEIEDGQIRELNRCITDLPRAISVGILLRLSVNKLLICKCVCKTWRSIIFDPEFARLHFAQGEVYPLIRSLSRTYVCRTLYLVEPLEYISDYSGWFNEVSMRLDTELKIPDYSGWFNKRRMRLDTKLKIPLRNAELVINKVGYNNNMYLPSKGSVKRKRCFKLRPEDHKFNIANSCNGLLCLSEPRRDDPVAVCNPITGEFVNLPVLTQVNGGTKKLTDSGLGFSPKTNQYKVIRMFDRQFCQSTPHPSSGMQINSNRVAEIHALGTGSWDMIGSAPSSRFKLAFPTYLNGALHWILTDSQISDFIVSFNFDENKFQSVPLPPHMPRNIDFDKTKRMSLGVLKGCLCLCDASDYRKMEIWVMKECGVQGSWEKEFCINTSYECGIWFGGLYVLMNCLSNGDILFFDPLTSGVFCYKPEGWPFKFLKLSGIESKFGAIAHVPSFISMKDTVMGDNLEVLNVKSRCAEFKLQGETNALFLVEADPTAY